MLFFHHRAEILIFSPLFLCRPPSPFYFPSSPAGISVDYRNMKVSKPTQVKGQTKSQKWKDVRGRRSRPPINPSELNSSPVMAKMAKEHQASVKKKPSVKRLKTKVKSVADSKKSTPQSVAKKPHTQANGSSAFTMDDESDDSQDWKEYSLSIQGNGVEPQGGTESVLPGRLEGEALHHCAQRNDRQNHAVLVMQKDQVCKSAESERKMKLQVVFGNESVGFGKN